MKNSANTETLDIKPETSASCGGLCCFITQFKNALESNQEVTKLNMLHYW